MVESQWLVSATRDCYVDGKTVLFNGMGVAKHDAVINEKELQ